MERLSRTVFLLMAAVAVSSLALAAAGMGDRRPDGSIGNPYDSVIDADSPFLSQSEGHAERYYPAPAPGVRWYVRSRVEDGAALDVVSDTIARREPLVAGGEVWLREIEDAAGTRTYHLEFGPQAVWLHATTYALQGTDVRVMSLTPPVPILQDPIDVGQRWAELTLREGELVEYAFEVVWRGAMDVLGSAAADCIAVDHLVDGDHTITSFYCAGMGPVASVTTGSTGTDSFQIRDELVAHAAGRLVFRGCEINTHGCAFGFDVDGFAAGETLEISLTSPAGDTFSVQVTLRNAPDGEAENEPSAGDILVLMPTGMEAGSYFVAAESPSACAWYVIRWHGACPVRSSPAAVEGRGP